MKFFNRGKPEKCEEVTIKMMLTGKRAHARHAQSLRDLPIEEVSDMERDDSLRVAYTLCIGYFGDVVKELEAVKAICSDPDVVVSASCIELTQGRVLVYESLKRLDAVIQEIEKRSQEDTDE
jgi:hypothetical protein